MTSAHFSVCYMVSGFLFFLTCGWLSNKILWMRVVEYSDLHNTRHYGGNFTILRSLCANIMAIGFWNIKPSKYVPQLRRTFHHRVNIRPMKNKQLCLFFQGLLSLQGLEDHIIFPSRRCIYTQCQVQSYFMEFPLQ